MPQPANVRIDFDGGQGDHDPDLYPCQASAELIEDLDALDAARIEQYHRDGYLAVRRALSTEQVGQAKSALRELIAHQPRSAVRYNLNFERSAMGRVDTLTPTQREAAVRKVFQFHGAHPALDAIMFDAKLLGVLERLGVAQPTLFQSMALLKGPGGREKPWHQDHAYFSTSLRDRVVGVWIALDEATPDNGCMFLLPGQHREPVVHFMRRDLQICDADIRRNPTPRVAVPLSPGGLLLFDSLLPHGTPTNHSPQPRWAMQFHYRSAAATPIDEKERHAVFGSEGKNVTC